MSVIRTVTPSTLVSELHSLVEHHVEKVFIYPDSGEGESKIMSVSIKSVIDPLVNISSMFSLVSKKGFIIPDVGEGESMTVCVPVSSMTMSGKAGDQQSPVEPHVEEGFIYPGWGEGEMSSGRDETSCPIPQKAVQQQSQLQ